MVLQDADELREAGADAVLAKPLVLDQLIRTMQELLKPTAAPT